MISREKIQELRDKTGVAVMTCKRALERAGGDFERALEFLKEEASVLASQKSNRRTRAGVIQSYVHAGKIGVLVELKCETDFVARNPEFQELAKELAMQLAASPAENTKELLAQSYIKNLDRTVGERLQEAIGKFGEKIEISRFSRLEL